MWSTEALASGASTSSPPRSRPNGTSKSPASVNTNMSTSRKTGADTDPTVWTYDASAFESGMTSTNGNASSSTGPKPSKSRLLWSRLAPEEEEREEEALPSYLTYLQPALTRTSSRSSSDQGRGPSGWEDAALAPSLSPNAAPFVQSVAVSASASTSASTEMTNAALPVLSVGAFAARNEVSNASNASVQAKAKEFAWALQEFVQQQVEQQQQQRKNTAPGFAGSNGSGCACGSCDEWKTRVSDLEQQVQLLQQQVGALVNGSPGVQTTASALRVNLTASSMHMPMVQPPPPPMPPPMPHSNGSPPLAPPPLGTASSNSIHSGLNDRISTLEGRQSAFQSQLAHISKVLGIPAGKHGKNNQLKTLVQTLHDEVDAKTAVAAQEMGARCRQALAQELVQNVERTVRAQLDMQFGTNAASPLSHDVILGALAEEHEASLARLNASVDERLAQENKRRTALESRVSRRLTEQEEWLQQLEGEFGSWHDMSSSVDAQLRELQRKLGAMEEAWNAQQTVSQQLLSEQGAKEEASVASGETKTKTGGGVARGGRKPSEAEVAALHALQAQLKQFQLEYKNELAALKDELALVDACGKTTRQESRDFATRLQALKQMVERVVRDTGNVEEVVQRSVRTITEQVASVTRDFVDVRIRENNRLIDATLRARVPAYVENESDRHQLVTPDRSTGGHAMDEDEAGAEDGGGMAWYGMPWNELGVQTSGGGKDPLAPMRVVVPGGSSATNSP